MDSDQRPYVAEPEAQDSINEVLSTHNPEPQASTCSEDSSIFYPPSNQLEMSSQDEDPSSAEANEDNTFHVNASARKRIASDRPSTSPPSIDDFANLLDVKFDRFATRSDFEGVIKQVNANASLISANREAIHSIRSDLAELKEAGGRSNMRSVVESVLKDNPSAPSRPERPLFRAGAKCLEKEKSRIKKYNVARSSIRVWPIPQMNVFMIDSIYVTRI